MGPGQKCSSKSGEGRKPPKADILAPDRLGDPLEGHLKCLDSLDPEQRHEAVRSLVRMCIDALETGAPEAGRLLKLFKEGATVSDFPDVRLKCQAALSICGEPPQEQAEGHMFLAALREEGPAILAGLEDRFESVRTVSMKRLGELCVAIKDTEPISRSLVSLLAYYISDSRFRDVKMGSIQILFFCGEKDALRTISFLPGEDPEVVRYRDEALKTLSQAPER